MEHCYLCQVELNPNNWSREHILLNSIGGHLSSRNLLCKVCNSKLGQDADAELAKQLAPLATYLQIRREDGEENKIIKGVKSKDGTIYNIVDGRKPVLAKPIYKRQKTEEKIEYSYTARNESEAIDFLKGLKRQYPELDIEEAKKNFQYKTEYINEYLSHNLTIGGQLALKSIVKTAVNYYILVTKNRDHVDHLFEYLKGNSLLEIAKLYHSKEPIYQIDDEEVVHLIHLCANGTDNLLYCYIEFFSSFSFLILLSDHYAGENFISTYCYDILKNEEVNKDITLNLKREDFNFEEKLKPNDFKIITEKLDRVMGIAQKKQTDSHIEEMIRETVLQAFSKYPNAKIFTEEILNNISSELALKYTKFICRNDPEDNTQYP